MSNTHEEAREIASRFFDEEMHTECGGECCTTYTYKFRENADYEDLVNAIASALERRDQKHQREVEGLEKKVVSSIQKAAWGIHNHYGMQNWVPEQPKCEGCQKIAAPYLESLENNRVFDSTRRKQLAEEEGGKE